MVSSRIFVACLFVLATGNTLAQSFPSKSLTLICPYPPAGITDQYLRALAQIASKYLGQPIVVENKPGELTSLGPVTMARTARPDGYTLSQFPVTVLRVPHMQRVNWDPLKDFSYVIGIAAYTYGIVVRSDSQIKNLKDLIDNAKANSGNLIYGAPAYGYTAHLAMEELGFKTGAKFLRVRSGTIAEGAKALIEGRISALSESSTWGSYVDAGVFRLLVTFGERRSRWNVPTAMELGLDILAYSPFGIVGPKGIDPARMNILHDAFNRALDDSEYAELLRKFDMVDWYKSSEDYAEWAADQFVFQRMLIERTIGLGRGLQN